MHRTSEAGVVTPDHLWHQNQNTPPTALLLPHQRSQVDSESPKYQPSTSQENTCVHKNTTLLKHNFHHLSYWIFKDRQYKMIKHALSLQFFLSWLTERSKLFVSAQSSSVSIISCTCDNSIMWNKSGICFPWGAAFMNMYNEVVAFHLCSHS